MSSRHTPSALPPFKGDSMVDSPGTVVVCLGLYELLRNGCAYLRKQWEHIPQEAQRLYYRVRLENENSRAAVDIYQPHLLNDGEIGESKMISDIRKLEKITLNRPQRAVVTTDHYAKMDNVPFSPQTKRCRWYAARWLYDWTKIEWEENLNAS